MSELPRLEGANCLDLPPQVAEKYFTAATRTFLGQTAARICIQCPALQDCWQQALMYPPEIGTQAGQPARVIRDLAKDMMREHGMVDVRYVPDEMLHPALEPLVIHHRRGGPHAEPGKRYPAKRPTPDVLAY